MKRHLEIQTNHKHLTPDGLPSYHVYDEQKKNVAAFVNEDDALLFVAAAQAKADGAAVLELSPSNDQAHP